jgi:hypothetical protein
MRYRSTDEDSARWDGFEFRPGDIVISTRTKHGTTWTQMICALLVFGTPDIPAPIADLSPWLDWLTAPREQVFARLAAQTHRRFIKTHTPLDGIPLDPRATYVVVARHPLDAAVSRYHQSHNLDRRRIRELSGQAEPDEPPQPLPPLHEWLVAWIDRDATPAEDLDSLHGVMWHITDAWARRSEPNVVLLHYADLADDLDGQMRALADRLGLASVMEGPQWTDLVRAAGFERMRERATWAVPDRRGVLVDPAAFFRRGRSGAAREELSDAEYERYLARSAELAPPEVLAWLHR